MTAARRTWTTGWIVAALVGLGPVMASAQDFTLSSTELRIGQPVTLTVDGEADSAYHLLFDLEEGDYTLPGGAWLGLGLSTAFLILDHGYLPADGRVSFSGDVPDDAGLVGVPLYFQVAGRKPRELFLLTSNRINPVIQGKEQSEITEVVPDASVAVRPRTHLEVLIDGPVDETSVVDDHVTLTSLSDGRTLGASVRLEEGAAGAALIIRPDRQLAMGSEIELTLSDAIVDDAGQPLVGPKQFVWSVQSRPSPRLLNNDVEFELMRRRVAAGEEPWKSAFEELKAEADQEAMPHVPQPRDGPPPNVWDDYVTFYNEWAEDSRYAQGLAMVWRITGETAYIDKAREILTAWLVFEPKQVGDWPWAIQTDIAGLSYLDALDLAWDDPGLTDDLKAQFKEQLSELADAMIDWQSITKNRDPGNIRSWTNTLIAGLGWFLQRDDLRDYAIERTSANPFPFLDMFDRALFADGEVWDGQDREDEQKFYYVTYSVYHLQAWSLLCEMGQHHGESLFYLQNQHGVTQEAGWSFYVPYLNGTKQIEGFTDEIKRSWGIAKYYHGLKAFRNQEMLDLFDVDYGEEPHWEPHIRKKMVTVGHRIPDGLTGRDDEPPSAPVALVPDAVGATTVQLRWEHGAFDDEGDLASAYLIYRNAELVGRTSDPGFVDHDLAPASSYHYRIHAVDYAGNASPALHGDVITRSRD